MKKPVTYRRKKVSKYVIACIVLIVVIFIGQSVMQMLAEMKYRAQRDQGTDIVEWSLGESQQICGFDVTVTGVEWRDEAEIELPEDQRLLVVQYQAQGSDYEILKISTLAYLEIDGQYLSSREYIDGMAYLGEPTVYSQYLEKEQGELVFIVPRSAEEITFVIQEYDDNVEPQQLKGSMLIYEPYEAPTLIHQYEIPNIK